jgi:type II secretory pathway component HofQ
MTTMLFAAILMWKATASSITSPVGPTPSAPGIPVVSKLNSDLNCSLNVVDWEVSKTLRLLSDETGVNMVLLATPGQKLTLHLQNVPLKDMVRHLCAISGLEHLEVDGTYVFATGDQLRAAYPEEYLALHPAPAPKQPDPPKHIEYASYRPKSADPDRLANELYQMFKSEKLSVVTSPLAQVPSSLPTDTELDPSINTGAPTTTTTPQSSAPTTGEASGANSLKFNGGGRNIILYGDSEVVHRALDAAKSLDAAPKQVDIQVCVYEISNDAANNLGISWSFGQMTITETPNGMNVGTFSRTGLTMDAVINALETKDKGKTLAKPNLATLDGTVASLLIGSQINYPDLIGYSNANTPIFGTKEVDAGISLQVSPLVADDGTVTMLIRPSVSTVTGYLQVNGASYPQLSTRKAQATVRVKSGDTIVLGGLMNSQDIDSIQKTPILSQIPVFGELFKTRNKTHSDDQIIITITPKVQTEP